MKKAGILNRHLSGALAELGHGDGVLVCDAGMPIPDGPRVVDLAFRAGVPSFAEVLDGLLAELVVEGGRRRRRCGAPIPRPRNCWTAGSPNCTWSPTRSSRSCRRARGWSCARVRPGRTRTCSSGAGCSSDVQYQGGAQLQPDRLPYGLDRAPCVADPVALVGETARAGRAQESWGNGRGGHRHPPAHFEGARSMTGPPRVSLPIRTPAIPPDPPPRVLMPRTTREVRRGLYDSADFFPTPSGRPCGARSRRRRRGVGEAASRCRTTSRTGCCSPSGIPGSTAWKVPSSTGRSSARTWRHGASTARSRRFSGIRRGSGRGRRGTPEVPLRPPLHRVFATNRSAVSASTSRPSRAHSASLNSSTSIAPV